MLSFEKMLQKKFKHLLQERQLYALSNFQVDTCNAHLSANTHGEKDHFLIDNKDQRIKGN